MSYNDANELKEFVDNSNSPRNVENSGFGCLEKIMFTRVLIAQKHLHPRSGANTDQVKPSG